MLCGLGPRSPGTDRKIEMCRLYSVAEYKHALYNFTMSRELILSTSQVPGHHALGQIIYAHSFCTKKSRIKCFYQENILIIYLCMGMNYILFIN